MFPYFPFSSFPNQNLAAGSFISQQGGKIPLFQNPADLRRHRLSSFVRRRPQRLSEAAGVVSRGLWRRFKPEERFRAPVISIQNVYSEKQRGHKTHQMFGEGF